MAPFFFMGGASAETAASAAAAAAAPWKAACVIVRLRSPIKFPARVLAVAHECDLAVLTVDNDDFWADTQGLLFGEVGCGCCCCGSRCCCCRRLPRESRVVVQLLFILLLFIATGTFAVFSTLADVGAAYDDTDATVAFLVSVSQLVH